jgi:long-subunit fatty acid transport protein
MPASARRLLWLLVLWPGIAAAQTVDVSIPPATLIPNDHRVPVGQEEALEGGAYVARANGAPANWYNPAGLALTKTAVINASINGYELSSINLANFDETGRTRRLDVLPGFFGVVLGEPVLKKKGLALGLSVTRQVSWGANLSATVDIARATGTEQIIYDSEVGFSTLTPQAALGYTLNDHWRVGAGLGVAITEFGRLVTISDNLLGPTTTDLQLQTSRLNGTVIHLVPFAGVQGDFGEHWKAGLMVRSIGIHITSRGNAQINAQRVSGTDAISASFLDTNSDFGYRPPLQVNAGLAYVAERFAVEADFLFSDSFGDMTLFKFDQPVRVTAVASGQPRVDSQVTLGDLVYRTRPTFNGAIGGRFSLTKALQLHAGFYTDFSPVDSSNEVAFQQIDIYGATLGASLSGEKVAGTLGVIFTHGRSATFNLAEGLVGGAADTQLSVNSFALLYALSYKF